MNSNPIDLIRKWNRANDRHTKLQHIYAASSIVMLVAAGLIGLINYALGQFILTVSFALAIIFFVNVIAWALIDAFFISRLNKRSSKR